MNYKLSSKVLFSLALIFLAVPAVENNLWSLAFVRDSQGGSLTTGHIPTLPETHPHARLLQARAAIEDHDNPLALQWIEPLLPTRDPVILTTYAELLFSLERYPEALEIWHSLGMYNKIEHAASALNDRELPDLKILALETAYDLRPDVYARSLQYAELERANQVRDAGQVTTSVDLYQAIIEQFPDYSSPYAELAWAYIQLGEADLAVSMLDAAMPNFSADYRFLMRAGSAYEQCGQEGQALEAYQVAAQVCSNCQDALDAVNRLTHP